MYAVFVQYIHIARVTGCDTRYTKEPLHDHRCVSEEASEVAIWQTGRPQCVSRCLITKSCHYINHNSRFGQCELGLSQCAFVVPASGMKVNAYGPPRHTCLHWGASDDPGFTLVESHTSYVGRVVVGDALIVGKSHGPGNGLAYSDGDVVGYIRDGFEFLGIAPTCTASWVSYTAGAPLPNGGVVGGYLASGTETYVISAFLEDAWHVGYYVTEDKLAHFEHYNAQTASSVRMLVLL